jgi:hypothetical protein
MLSFGRTRGQADSAGENSRSRRLAQAIEIDQEAFVLGAQLLAEMMYAQMSAMGQVGRIAIAKNKVPRHSHEFRLLAPCV